MNLFRGDNLEHLQFEDSNSIDAVVTDPPYGLSFMGKKWDYDVPSVELWREVFRVIKPGGHLLSFGGTRTYHRMVVNIEDAGFEVRDQIMWLYGSGFPKSLNIDKAIDKAAGAERKIIGHANYTAPDIRGNSYDQAHVADRERLGVAITAPATADAKRWQGWGTALKPANEPIVLARKPLEKGLTVAENVLKWGTGAINVDGARIEAADQAVLDAAVKRMTGNAKNAGAFQQSARIKPNSAQGRWPANVLFDEEAARRLDEQSGVSKSVKSARGGATNGNGKNNAFGTYNKELGYECGFADSGGASRFFYVAKTSKRERNAGLEGMPEREPPGSKRSTPAEGRTSALVAPRANHHPTVKPIKLMEYLCKLITPPGGTILDPFMGSGSTGCAAARLGFKFVGIELEKEYFEIAKKRIGHHQKGKRNL